MTQNTLRTMVLQSLLLNRHPCWDIILPVICSKYKKYVVLNQLRNISLDLKYCDQTLNILNNYYLFPSSIQMDVTSFIIFVNPSHLSFLLYHHLQNGQNIKHIETK